MNPPTKNDEQLLEHLVRVSGQRLDPNAVAAAATGPRGAAEVADVARDPEAVLLLRAIAKQRRRKQRVLWSGAGLAACLLAGVVLALVHDDSGGPMDPLGVRLEAAVARLGRLEPERFAELALARAEDLAGTSGVVRGGAAWLGPRGTVLEAPRQLAWRRPDGMGRVQVTLKGPGIAWEQVVDADTIDMPALGSGRYVVTLRMLDGWAGQTVRRAFVVADDVQRTIYENARASWQAQTDADLHDLIEAHYAFSRGFFGRALDAARRADAAGGDARALVQPLLRHLER